MFSVFAKTKYSKIRKLKQWEVYDLYQILVNAWIFMVGKLYHMLLFIKNFRILRIRVPTRILISECSSFVND